jgi:hypothetical protein
MIAYVRGRVVLNPTPLGDEAHVESAVPASELSKVDK